MKKLLVLLLCFSFGTSMAQKDDYFYQIPEAPESFSSANILARMVDGLGFRYYWATFGLEQKDLAYKPNEESRATLETIRHIEGLTEITRNTVYGVPTDFSKRVSDLSFQELRAKTLKELEEASKYLREHELNPEIQKVIFKSSNGETSYPIWNAINGPIEDAIWHVGQVVSFRRSSGNPLPSGVNVLLGSKTDY